ncbi:MAG: hypothetical protein A2Y91_07155 [Chloroflexi bacterium RBG_13_54_8]|nr:MAG: hypothetical protein A2Y91_07155 [Chloroflexi bacterium RBG_13_54_8]
MVEREKVIQKHVRIPGASIELEGILHLPPVNGTFPAVAVCHPHPLYGGDMHNSVVLAICTGLGEASIAALRFNFRGVGRSQGNYADGVGEQDDLISALSFLKSVAGVDPSRIGLAGYSFGAMVALPVALRQEQLGAVALVSPFLTDAEWEQLRSYAVPKLFLCGSEDSFISSLEVQRLTEGLPGTSQCQVIPGADHFWWGFEAEIAARVTGFFEEALKI